MQDQGDAPMMISAGRVGGGERPATWCSFSHEVLRVACKERRGLQ